MNLIFRPLLCLCACDLQKEGVPSCGESRETNNLLRFSRLADLFTSVATLRIIYSWMCGKNCVTPKDATLLFESSDQDCFYSVDDASGAGGVFWSGERTPPTQRDAVWVRTCVKIKSSDLLLISLTNSVRTEELCAFSPKVRLAWTKN